MTGRKLSDTDKQEILYLYRTTGETTSTLADRYGVSNSTISRLLKSILPEDEYESLIATKRAARTQPVEPTIANSFSIPDELELTAPEPMVEPSPEAEVAATTTSSLRRRRRSSDSPELETVPLTPTQTLLNLEVTPPVASVSSLDEDSGAQATAVAEIVGEDLLDEAEDLTDLDDEDDEDELDDLDLEDDLELDEEEDLAEDEFLFKSSPSTESLVQVLPLSAAALPRSCYLVIDRASELITRPLRDFRDLGQIPSQEVQQRTLPVFDNHRVARRFSTKRDRIIKIPDSRLLQKAGPQLQAKGITRLLIDGQVYSL